MRIRRSSMRFGGNAFLGLVGSVVLVQLLGFLSAVGMSTGDASWYGSLVRPVFAPANWIFGVVWPILYVMLGVVLYRLWVLRKLEGVSLAMRLFWVQMLLNVAWSPVYFGMESIVGGLILILVLDVFVVLLVRKVAEFDVLSFYLLLPYFAWLIFATMLNVSFLILN